MGGGEAVSGTGDTATAGLEAWGPGHLTLLHAQEGSQQQRQEDLHSGGTGVWLGSQEAEVSPPADAGTRPGGVPAQTAR